MTSFASRVMAAAAALVCMSSLAGQESIEFHIASQPLSSALKSFAAQANMQLLYRNDAVEGATANALVGSFEKRAALEYLLRGTGLEVIYSADNAATIAAGMMHSLTLSSIALPSSVPAR